MPGETPSPQLPPETLGVVEGVEQMAVFDTTQGVVADADDQGVGSLNNGFKPPEGIGYHHEAGETYAEIDSRLGGGRKILVPPEGPFPDIPRDIQRQVHRDVRDRILVAGDVVSIQKPAEKRLRDHAKQFEGFRGLRSADENYSQPINIRRDPPVYNEELTREMLGPVLSDRFIHEDYDVNADIPVADIQRAQEIARVIREALVGSELMDQETAERLVTATRVVRYDDEEIVAEIEAGNVEFIEGARTQETSFVMGALRILDPSRPVEPTPRRRGVKIRERASE